MLVPFDPTHVGQVRRPTCHKSKSQEENVPVLSAKSECEIWGDHVYCSAGWQADVAEKHTCY